MKITYNSKNKSILIDNRYEMYSDGVIYDTKSAKDIPNWIFTFREFILDNHKTMISGCQCKKRF